MAFGSTSELGGERRVTQPRKTPKAQAAEMTILSVVTPAYQSNDLSDASESARKM